MAGEAEEKPAWARRAVAGAELEVPVQAGVAREERAEAVGGVALEGVDGIEQAVIVDVGIARGGLVARRQRQDWPAPILGDPDGAARPLDEIQRGATRRRKRGDPLDSDAVGRELDQLQRAVERGGDQVARDLAVEGGRGIHHQAVGRGAELRQRC